MDSSASPASRSFFITFLAAPSTCRELAKSICIAGKILEDSHSAHPVLVRSLAVENGKEWLALSVEVDIVVNEKLHIEMKQEKWGQQRESK